MAVNKVVYCGREIMDLTGDTVSPDTLMQGVTAHNAAGESIVGTVAGGSDGWKLLRRIKIDERAEGVEYGMSTVSGYENTVSGFYFDTDSEGKKFAVRELFITGTAGIRNINYFTVHDAKKWTGYGNLAMCRSYGWGSAQTLREYNLYISTCGTTAQAVFTRNENIYGADPTSTPRVDEPIKGVCISTFLDNNILPGSEFEIYGRTDGGTAETGGSGGQKHVEIFVPCLEEFKTTEGYQLPAGYFQGNTNISAVEIAEGITGIGANAFSDCAALAKVILPATLKEIGYGAFQTGKKEIYLHSETAPSVGTAVFNDGDKFFVPESAVKRYKRHPQNADEIMPGSGAGWAQTDINTNNIFSLAKMGEKFIKTFIPCQKEFKTPEGIYKIPDKCFYWNKNISAVEIAEGVTDIGDLCFTNTSNLAEIVLPSTIKRLGANCFADGDDLPNFDVVNVTIKAVTPPAFVAMPFTTNAKVILYVPAESVQAYKDAGMIMGRGEVLPIPEASGGITEADKAQIVQDVLAALPTWTGGAY